MAKNNPIESKEEKLSREERTRRVLDDPDCFDTIIANIQNGGSLTELARIWDIRYSDIMKFLNADKARLQAYFNATKDRGEWAVESVLAEIKKIAHADIRDLYDEEGLLKPVDQWPDEIAASVTALDTEELYEYEDKKKVEVGRKRKIKLADKLRALELYGKQHSMFVQKHEVKAELSYEDYLSGSYKEGDPFK